MVTVYTKYFPFGSYTAITLVPFLFIKEKYKKYFDEYDYNHECIHERQAYELLIIFFYLWYGIEYLIKRLINLDKSQNDVYYMISFEREAYENEKNLDYLNNRKWYSWFKYI